MIRTTLALTFGLVPACLAAPVAMAAGPELKTTRVELPQGGDMFAGGDKADAINGNCLACHSTGMVLMQPALSREEWAKEVAKMKKVYGAPVADADVPAIVDYLAALKPTN